MCCNGIVNDVSDPTYQYRCCGDQAYHYQESICCPGNILEAVPDEFQDRYYQYKCCLDEETGKPVLYNVSTHTCCDGRLQEKKHNLWATCCGKHIYDHDTEGCCNGEVYQQSNNLGCCADEVIYDITFQRCCATWNRVGNDWVADLMLHDKTSNTSQCCGRELYDTKTHVCCDETIIEKPANIPEDMDPGCCNRQVFNQENQICCQKWELVDGVYEATNSKIHDKLGNRTTCCGENIYNYQEEVCCNDGLVLSKPEGSEEERNNMWCCGTEIVSSLNNQLLCIDKKLVTVEQNSDVWTCGNGTYDPTTTQRCCYDVLYDWLSNDTITDNSCCYEAQDAYNSNTELCCGDVVVTRDEVSAKEEDNACCFPYQ